MSFLSPNPKTLWIRYLVAIILIFAFLTLNQGAMHMALDGSESFSEAINKSGRQRMLSQRIVLFATQVTYSKSLDASAGQNLKIATNEFEAAHQILAGGPNTDPIVELSEALNRKYFGNGPDEDLDRESRAFIIAARKVSRAEDQDGAALAHLTRAATKPFLQKLDEAVHEFEALAQTRNAFVETVATLGYALAVFVLGLVFIGILYPAHRLTLRSITALENSEEKFRSILSSTPDGLVIVDQKAVIQMANSRVLEILGQDPDDLVGHKIEVLLPESSRDKHVALRDGFLKAPNVRSMGSGLSLQGQHKNGSCVPVEVSLSPIAIDNQRWIAASIRDITERTEAENKLKEASLVISDSIAYAARIQSTILSDIHKLDPVLRDGFVLWEPRDGVGGDVYWCDYWGDGVLIILADCTGHGVPGAFLTMLATGALDRARTESFEGDLQGLITSFHKTLQKTLGQTHPNGQSNDGLDLGACYIAGDMEKMYFVGAGLDLFVAEGGAVKAFQGSKKGVGYRSSKEDEYYDVHEIALSPHRRFYLTTDGLLDQIGGPRNRGFGKARFKRLLGSIQASPLEDHKAEIHQALLDYQGVQSRRDDVAIIGFEVL